MSDKKIPRGVEEWLEAHQNYDHQMALHRLATGQDEIIPDISTYAPNDGGDRLVQALERLAQPRRRVAVRDAEGRIIESRDLPMPPDEGDKHG